MRLAVIGVPYNSAGLLTGEARAPAALRAAGLLSALRACADVIDDGDVRFTPPLPIRDATSGVIAPRSLTDMVGAVRSQVARALTEDRFPLVIGGECPLILGCLAAARDTYGRVGLFFVDGHEDAWPPHQSTTGEAADMELGFALGRSEASSIDNLNRLLPLIRPEDTVVLGPRDSDELAAAGVPSVASLVMFQDDEALHAADAAATVRAHINHVARRAGHWWFHLDLDVLATDAFPAIRYPQPGGLDWDRLETIAEAALKSPGLIGWNITIYNPDLDPTKTSASRLIAFLDAMSRHLN